MDTVQEKKSVLNKYHYDDAIITNMEDNVSIKHSPIQPHGATRKILLVVLPTEVHKTELSLLFLNPDLPRRNSGQALPTVVLAGLEFVQVTAVCIYFGSGHFIVTFI
jgi:hypothetical protein